MELTWIKDFLALASSGSFSRAAEQRHVTQPAFSRRIRSLEDWLGVELFDRTVQPAMLTEAGQRFRPRAEDLVRRIGAAREAAREAAGASLATLRFAATHALSLSFFPAWLRGLEPRLRLGPIQLVSDTLQACEELMLLGRSQFMLCHHHPDVAGRLDPDGFRSVRIARDTLVPVTVPDEAGRPRFGLSAEAGAAVPVLAYSEASGLGRIQRALRRSAPAGPPLQPAFTSHLAVVLKTMALDGRGIAWLPLSLIRQELAEGQLVGAGGEAWHLPLEIRLFRRRAPEAAEAEAFWQVAEAGLTRDAGGPG